MIAVKSKIVAAGSIYGLKCLNRLRARAKLRAVIRRIERIVRGLIGEIRVWAIRDIVETPLSSSVREPRRETDEDRTSTAAQMAPAA
jgi:hypothetical protein